MSNWVERRAAREHNLRSAHEVWQKAQAALAETCDSLQKYYSGVATIQRTLPSKDIIAITIIRTPPSGCGTRMMPATSSLSIEFQSQAPRILVVVDGETIREFVVEADSDHAFISFQGNEVILDEFSRLALEDFFFGPSIPVRGSLRLKRLK